MSEKKESGFWAIVEVMGHSRYAGYVSEQALGGASFVRVDVPLTDVEGFTKLFGAQAIYAITPVSKDAARAAAWRIKEQPMSVWDIPDDWRQAIQQGLLGDDSDSHAEADL